jgi:hypothetical protein
MGRFKCIAAGIAAIFLVVVFYTGTPVSALPDEIVPLWGPYLTSAGETCMTVNWRTEESQAGSVEYATEDFYTAQGSYSDFVNDTAGELHHVQLTDLSPDTTYHYRLEIGGQYTADYTFTTFGSESFTFIVYGDTREQAPMYTQLERHKLVADRIAEEENVLFVLHTGDLVCDDSDLEEWGRFFESTRNMMSCVPMFPVLGNHESSSGTYADAFNVPDWYSFDCSNAHFSMLDTNQELQDQTDWLNTDLTCDADWKFVVFHHPPYSSSIDHWGGWLDVRAAWEPVFMEKGVNAVFNAHVHVYERYLEDGIHYMVLGNGGAPCYLLAEEKIAGYRNSLEHTLGYVRITVNGDEAIMDVIKVAEISEDNREVVQIYPPETVFETVDLRREALSGSTSIEAITRLYIPGTGIMLDRESIDYGSISPGDSSSEETIGITNIGDYDVNVTLEILGEETAQDFYEQSLVVNGSPYSSSLVLTSISVDQTEQVSTMLHVPPDWNIPGVQNATFIFWAENQ